MAASEARRWPHTWTWRDEPCGPGDCVVVDVDGVLADAEHRQHHLQGSYVDWDAFFADVADDDPFTEVTALLRLLDERLMVVALTSRPHWVHDDTVAWLNQHDVRWDLLVMRSAGDFRASPVVKREAATTLADHGFNPVLAIDDDMRNVRMFRNAGIETLYLHSGYHPN